MDILEFLQSIVSVTQANTLAYLVGANLILGVLAALVKGQLELVKLMAFGKRIVLVFGSYLAAALAAKALADFSELRDAMWVALIAYLAAQIISNITELTGIKLPEKLQKWLER